MLVRNRWLRCCRNFYKIEPLVFSREVFCIVRKGQSSVEYLFIVGISLLVIIPTSFLFLSYSKNSEDAVVSSQINRVGTDIMQSVEEVFIIGNNSWVTLEVSLPSNVKNVTIYGESELVIHYFSQTGVSDAVFFSDINITNSTNCLTECVVDLTGGKNSLRVSSLGDEVSLTRS